MKNLEPDLDIYQTARVPINAGSKQTRGTDGDDTWKCASLCSRLTHKQKTYAIRKRNIRIKGLETLKQIKSNGSQKDEPSEKENA